MKLIPLIYAQFSHNYPDESSLLPGIKYSICVQYLSFLRSQALHLSVELTLIKKFSKFLGECVDIYTYCRVEGDCIVFYSLDSQEELLESATFKPIFLSESLVRLETFRHSQTLGIPFRHGSTVELIA